MNKIHIKKVLLDALRHFVALIVSCLGGYFISNGVFGLIGLLISNNNKLVFRLFYFVPYFAIVTIVFFLVSFKTEKKEKNSLLMKLQFQLLLLVSCNYLQR